MGRLQLGEKNLQSWGVAAGYRDQERGTTRATSFIFVYQQPPECQRLTNAGFRRRNWIMDPRSQCGIFQSSLFNVWERSVTWDLPIYLIECNCIAIRWAFPIHLSLGTITLGDSIQIVNKFNGLPDSSSSFFIHYREASSKAYDKANPICTIRVCVYTTL